MRLTYSDPGDSFISLTDLEFVAASYGADLRGGMESLQRRWDVQRRWEGFPTHVRFWSDALLTGRR